MPKENIIDAIVVKQDNLIYLDVLNQFKSEAYLTICIDNKDEVVIRVVKEGVKIGDITMGDIGRFVEWLKKEVIENDKRK